MKSSRDQKKTSKPSGSEAGSKDGGPFFKAANKSLPPDVQAKMESTFGQDFSGVEIHKNSGQASDLNALAFTQGESIHFAPGQFNPSSTEGQQLIGHELAHVTQQRSGSVVPTVQAKGLGINEDQALEQEANMLGKKAAGSSPSATYQSKALGIRNNLRTAQLARNGVVQLASFPTFFGEFKDKTYKKIGKSGVDIELEFHPAAHVNATKIGLTQIVKSKLGGSSTIIHPTQESRMVNAGYAEGFRIDRIAERNNPIYGAQSLAATDKLAATGNAGAIYRLGWNFKDKGGALQTKEAYLKDTPTLPGRSKDSGQYFETTALGIEGAQAGTYFGSVSWGWEVDSGNKFSILPITVVSKAAPSDRFFKAAEKWNATTSLGTIKTVADPTNVYNNSFNKSFTVPKDEVVTIRDAVIHNKVVYQNITVASTGKTGRIKTGDLKDQGDGAATADLPVVAEIYAGPFDSIFDIAPIAQVEKSTKVKLLQGSDQITAHVEVMEGSFLGTTGYVNAIGGIPFTNVQRE